MQHLNVDHYQARRYDGFTLTDWAHWLLAPTPRKKWNRRRRWRATLRWLTTSAQVRSTMPGDWLTLPTSDVYLWVRDCKPHGLICIPVAAAWMAGPLRTIGGIEALEHVLTTGSHTTGDGARKLTIIRPKPGLFRWQHLAGATNVPRAALHAHVAHTTGRPLHPLIARPARS